MAAVASHPPPWPAARGDEAELFTTYSRRLQREVRRVVRTSPENIEDACAFAFLQLLRHQPARDAAYAWLATTAVREALKLDRRARRTLPLEHDDGDTHEPADHVDAIALRLDVLAAREAIGNAALSPRQQRIVALQVLGLSYDEIAAETGDTLRQIERQIDRARNKLRRALHRSQA